MAEPDFCEYLLRHPSGFLWLKMSYGKNVREASKPAPLEKIGYVQNLYKLVPL